MGRSMASDWEELGVGHGHENSCLNCFSLAVGSVFLELCFSYAETLSHLESTKFLFPERKSLFQSQ